MFKIIKYGWNIIIPPRICTFIQKRAISSQIFIATSDFMYPRIGNRKYIAKYSWIFYCFLKNYHSNKNTILTKCDERKVYKNYTFNSFYSCSLWSHSMLISCCEYTWLENLYMSCCELGHIGCLGCDKIILICTNFSLVWLGVKTLEA